MKMAEAWFRFEHSGFFAQMRLRLSKKEKLHIHEPTLASLAIEDLVTHLEEEIDELCGFLKAWKANGVYGSPPLNLKRELADVATMCGFVFSKLEAQK